MSDLNMIDRGLVQQRAVTLNAMKAVVAANWTGTGRLNAEQQYVCADDLGRRIREHVVKG
jgi:hypothetical protein